MRQRQARVLLWALLGAGFSGTAGADAATGEPREAGNIGETPIEPNGTTGEPTPLPEPASHGLNFALDLASAYNFRGLNIFQADSQHDLHALLAPSVTFSVGDTGLWLNYWGAFQLNGPNRQDLILEGVGQEVDLSIGYDQELLEGDLMLSAAFVSYLYPFADPDLAGTGTPTWLEPMAGITWETFASLGLSISYMTHLQQVLAGWDYLYVNPTASMNFPLGDRAALEPGISAGWKVWTDGPAWQDNTADVTLDLDIPVEAGSTTLTAGLHVTWTNLEDTALLDQTFAWGSLGASMDW